MNKQNENLDIFSKITNQPLLPKWADLPDIDLYMD